MDSFTKWLELVPLPSQEAEGTARAAVNEFFARFGNPLSLMSDQGRNFESRVFHEMCRVLGILKARTSGFRPSANGQVERANRQVLAAIRAYVDKKQDDWDENLALIAAAIRSYPNRQTGFSPNRLMLGREVNTPVDIAFGSKQSVKEDPQEYAVRLREALIEAHEVARKTLKASNLRMKQDYDLKAFKKQLKVGDPVFCVDHSVKKGRVAKLRPTWKGPGLVMKVLTPFLYVVRFNNQEKADKVVNHDETKLCTDDPITLPRWLRRQKEGLEKQKAQKYCICGSEEDQSFMVQCSKCFEWFHGFCIKLTPAQAARGPYHCAECLRQGK